MKDTYGEIFTNVLSDWLKSVRKSKGLNQRYLAQEIGISRNTYATYELGSRDMPLSLFKKICKFYGIDFYKAFEFIGKRADSIYEEEK